MRSKTFYLTVLVTSLSFATPALAQDAPKQPTKAELEEAQRRYQRGRELYEENDATAALVEIRRAYELAPSYKLLFDIGQICYQLQDYPCALRSFTKYLDEGKSEIAAPRRSDVQNDIEKLKARVATLRIRTSRPGAEISVDDVVIGKTPLETPAIVGAGKRRVTAKIAGAEPVTKVVEVAGTDVVDIALELGAAQATPDGGGASGSDNAGGGTPPSNTGGGGSALVVPWVFTGLLAVGAGVTGGLALSASSSYREKLDTFGTTRSDLNDAHDNTKKLALVTDIFLGATVIAAGVSLFITFTGPAKKTKTKRDASLPVSVDVGPGNVWLRGTF